MFVICTPEYQARVRKIVGDPAGYTEGKAINPLFTIGLPVSAVPEELQEEYQRFLTICALQREAQKNWPLRHGSIAHGFLHSVT